MAFKDLWHFDPDAAPDWPQRAWLLAALGAGSGLLIHLLTRAGTTGPAVALRGAAVLFVGIAALLLAFTFERVRPQWGIGFAVGAAALVAAVSLLLGGPLAWWDELWRLLCMLLVVAIAAPLFQAARDEGRARFPYVRVHDHVWTNVMLAAAALSFTGIVFLVLLLLGALFRLIGLDLLWGVVTAPWFIWTLGSAASLGAVGWLRERVGVMRGTVGILALLAPIMGAGLAIFLLSVPFTGLEPLWEATRSTTPILLGCIAGGLVIANAVIGAEGDEQRPRAMLWGALAIAIALLPLALIGAVSVATRIRQYGLLPERIWAVIFVGIAVAYSLGYLVSILRYRRDWPAGLREANLRLSVGLGLVALFLALPIIDFNAISARDQVVRLERGTVTPARFDYAALRFRMGAPGREALAALSRSDSPDVRGRAAEALASNDRYRLQADQQRADVASIRVVPVSRPVPPLLTEAITDLGVGGVQALVYEGGGQAVLVTSACDNCPTTTTVFRLIDDRWTNEATASPPAPALRDARIEVRPIRRRQVFVDGAPVGEPFE